MNDVIVRFIDLPVPGMTVTDPNGDFNMYINARLSAEGRKKVYKHEMNHINKDHFSDDRPISDIEKEAG